MREASGRGDAIGVAADVGIAEGCRSLIAAQPEADILVNNLGIYGACEFFEIDDALWEQYFEVNVLSGVRLARHYAKGMRERGWGRIQFISSESALNIPTEMVHYGVSKAAVQGLSRGLAKVLAGSGVTVNAILPGPTRTEGAITMMANLAAERGVSPSEMEACSWPRTDLRHCCGASPARRKWPAFASMRHLRRPALPRGQRCESKVALSKPSPDIWDTKLSQ